MSTPQEFRAWFEGFTESIEEGEVPTRKQWDRIKKKIKEIYFPYVWNQTYYYPVYPYPYTTFNTINCVSATYTNASSPELVGMNYNMANNINYNMANNMNYNMANNFIDPNILWTNWANTLNAMYTRGKNDYNL